MGGVCATLAPLARAHGKIQARYARPADLLISRGPWESELVNSSVELSERLMGNLIALTRDNLHELEAIERLASTLGADRFCTLALQIAYEYPIKIEESYQSVRKQQHSSVIGMSDAPFEALRSVCEVVIHRAPDLLRILSYRHRHDDSHDCSPWTLASSTRPG